jgi:hypothetical protein
MTNHDVLCFDHRHRAVAPSNEVDVNSKRPCPPIVAHHSAAPNRVPAESKLTASDACHWIVRRPLRPRRTESGKFPSRQRLPVNTILCLCTLISPPKSHTFKHQHGGS